MTGRGDPERLGGPAPLVSVIIRTRNRPRLLAEALESVASQTWPEVEVVVINDGGTSVDDVVSRFSQRISLIHHRLEPAAGRVAAANAGLELARGAWVCFLDDDDILRPAGIAALMEQVQTPDDVVYGTVPARLYREDEERILQVFGRPYDPDLMLFENFIPIIGCVMPAAAVASVGGLDESLECFEDWDLFLRLGDVAHFRFVAEEVAEYRVFEGGFLTGEGGQELQRRGREQIYAKHRHRLKPGALARCQELVKTRLIPSEAARLGGEERQRLEEHVRFLKAQLAASHEGVAALQARVEGLEEEKTRLQAILKSAGSTMPPVSVVLVNYNGREHLERCLPALTQTRRVPIEIIVVDNGSADGSVSWLRETFPDVRVIAQDRNLGFGAANAVGIRAAQHAFVALLNADTVVDPDWLYPLLETLMQDPDAGAVCSTLRLLERPGILNAHGGGMSKLGFGFDHDFGMPYRAGTAMREVLFPTAAAMLMRRRDFERFGGFDPAFFMYHEDVDLGWRIWLSGQKVLCSEASEVFHLFGGTTRSERSLAWREKLGARHSFRSILVCARPVTILKVVKGLLRLWRQTHTLGVGLHVMMWNVVRLPSTIARRRWVQRGRQISDRELIERGLISIGPYPAPPPELPRGRGAEDAGRWIRSNVLLPGHASALGRLGPGWYRPERVADAMARVSSGRAFCWLKTDAECSGALVIRVHVPPEAAGRILTVRCNGVEARQELDGALWQEIRLWVVADSEGVLRVELLTDPWTPHHLSANWDFRTLGVAVESVRFVPDEPEEEVLNPLVSVIITTFNRRQILERALGAWERQSWERLELIVVDDGSSDGTAEALKGWRDRVRDRLRAEVIHQENAGQGRARNRGLQAARGDLVVFVGDDIIPEPSFVEEHVRQHLKIGDPCAVVGFTDWDRGSVRVTRAMELVNSEGHQFGYAFMNDGEDVPYTCFYTSNISVPREALGSEPFDPAFRVYGWEDVELGYRLSLAGLRIVYAASARAVHCHPMDFTALYRRQIAVGRSLATLLELHPEIETDDVMPPARARLVIRALSRVGPAMVPLLGFLDRAGIPVPRRLLRGVLEAGFVAGRRSVAPSG
ncbi:MAG: glycosyltransferase [Acidobacteria bacterium]|nr:glycosyltransferase [Acidobacteriota bacterium]